MAKEQTYYEKLGLTKTASEADIKKAFKKLAVKHHPDSGGDAEKFKDISEAYEVLTNKDKKADYDEYLKWGGAAGVGRAGGGGYNGPFSWQDMGSGGYTVNINDIFGGAAGGGFSSIFDSIRSGGGVAGTNWDFKGARKQNGAEVKAKLKISFAEAYNGSEKAIKLKLPSGPLDLTVKVPAGAQTGGKLRYKGKGNPGTSGGKAGDLVIEFEVAANNIYTKEGNNIIMDLPISVDQAAFGADIVISTPDNKQIKLKIPPHSNTGQTLSIKGKGWPLSTKAGKDGQFGDLLVKLAIKLPEKLTTQQEQALKKFAEACV